MRTQSLLLILALAAACGDGTPISDVPLQVTAGVEEVALGRAFPLTVVRTWSKGSEPADWSDETLVVLPTETTRREDGTRVEETRRYDAYAFSLDDLTTPVELRVKRALDPRQPGPAELPGAVPAKTFPWRTVGVALAALLLLLRRRRPTAEPPPPEPDSPAQPAPHLRALARLARARRAELQACYAETAALLRDYAGVRAAETTEDLQIPRLAAVLQQCDLVKFARHAPAADERERMLGAAESFIKETA